MLRHTEDGRIYGATFIDHRTGCVLNGSRMGRELSANALQEHFTLPYANEEPITMTVPAEESVPTEDRNAVRPKAEEYTDDFHISGAGLFSPDGSTIDPEEEAFIRACSGRRKRRSVRDWECNIVFFYSLQNKGTMSQEDDLRALAKIMDFLRA